MRFHLRPQKHNAAYPYDGGWAVFDSVENRQVGYFAARARAEAAIEERNAMDQMKLEQAAARLAADVGMPVAYTQPPLQGIPAAEIDDAHRLAEQQRGNWGEGEEQIGDLFE